jgi:hypothetical protein
MSLDIEKGELAFPLQVAIPLSEPGRDFTGGEFVLTEQRMRSRAEVVPLRQGNAVAFPSTTGRSGAAKTLIASTCVAASAARTRAGATPSGSSSTMCNEPAPLPLVAETIATPLGGVLLVTDRKDHVRAADFADCENRLRHLLDRRLVISGY